MNKILVDGEKTSQKKTYKVDVDGEKLHFDYPTVRGRDILEKAGKIPPECHSLYQKLKGHDFEKISLDENVDLANPGIERFTVKPPDVFYYMLDEEPETSAEEYLSANRILEEGGLVPVTDYYLIEIDSAGQEISHRDTPDEPIQMRCPGSKFVSVFRGETPVS
jgi:hypothetical protein